MPRSDKALIAVLLVIAAGMLLSNTHEVFADAGVRGTFQRSFKVDGPVTLRIKNNSGAVNVRRGGSSQVEIHAEIRVNDWFGGPSDEAVKKIEQNPPVQQSGNEVRISVPEPESMFRRVSINYEISVPENTNVEASTGSGSETVESVKGPVAANSGSGSIHLISIGSATRAETGSGSIELRDINGAAEVSTGSGSVTATKISGAFRGRTGSGRIDMDQSAPGDVDAETGSGHIELKNLEGSLRAHAGSGHISADGRPKGSWELHSGSGSIDVRVAGDVGLDLYARAGSGSVEVTPPVTMESSTINRHEVRGKIRGGGVRLEATTSSGSIHIQ
jgi:hypothetical protein